MRRALLILAFALVVSTALGPASLRGDGGHAAATRHDDASRHPAGGTPPLDRRAGAAADAGRSGPAAMPSAIPLAPRQSRDRRRPSSTRVPAVMFELRPLLTAAASLGMVLGLFFIAAWAMRRGLPANHTLPAEAFEVLGRAPLAGKHQVYLARLGNKLLLLCLTPSGPCSLGEIDQPEEVERIAGLCAQHKPHSSTAAFRQALAEASRAEGNTGGRLSRGGRHA